MSNDQLVGLLATGFTCATLSAARIAADSSTNANSGYTAISVLLGWAQAWRGKVSDDYVKKQVVSDPHFPASIRVIGPARNTDVCYDAFKVQSTDRIFVAPEQRVRIW